MSRLSKYNVYILKEGIRPMSENSEYVNFDEALDEDDWGLIIGSNGALKGLFIPKGKEQDLVPESIVDICEQYFGVDLNADNDINTTLH